MNYGFTNVAAACPKLIVADCDFNTDEIIRLAKKAEKDKVSLLVFPELCITGATCGDLFLQQWLLSSALKSLERILEASHSITAALVVGLPLQSGSLLFNCAAVIFQGDILGVVPKSHLSARDLRCFSPACRAPGSIELFGKSIPFEKELIFSCLRDSRFSFGVEIGSDNSEVIPASAKLSLNGAFIIAHPDCTPEKAGNAEIRLSSTAAQSARCVCAYIEAGCAMGESTTDEVFSGRCAIFENGGLLAEAGAFSEKELLPAQIDLDLLSQRRLSSGLFGQAEKADVITFDAFVECREITRNIPRDPFMPFDGDSAERFCLDIFAMQAAALKKRFEHTHSQKAVIGISGGLDSTLALLALCKAFDMMEKPRADITAVTMPCFGTSRRTRDNAEKLCSGLGITLKEINITQTVLSHFSDIGQSPEDHGVAFENSQARERTQVLMDMANQQNGLVIGTGDLSELALGWATYNGDHMSMYGVNGSIPKTLVRHLVSFWAGSCENSDVSDVLLDILDTPVSPELLPPEEGKISQATEDLVGPYILHDFFIYHTLKNGFGPAKVLAMAQKAFEGQYDRAFILRWMKVFYRRFFSQQFKRSCMPDGADVTGISLSPRGGFAMPSDAVSRLWLDEVNRLEAE